MPYSLTPLWQCLRTNFFDAIKVSKEIFQVIVPIIIVLKILDELDWIQYLALPLQPIMDLVNLPADLGIVWASGIMVNIYSALIVMAGMVGNLPDLTQAQASIFALMLLFGHSLPAECGIAQRCGVSFIGQCVIRMGAAIVIGFLLHLVLDGFGLLQAPAVMAFPKPTITDPTLLQWAGGELRNLIGIACIIYCVMLLQRFLKYCHAADHLGTILRPMLHLLGLSSVAATTVVIGMVTGLLYGSGIIIQEAKQGGLTKHEIFAVLTLLSLAHALIEDTLLMLLMDASIVIVLVLRFIVAIAVGVAFNQYYLRKHSAR